MKILILVLTFVSLNVFANSVDMEVTQVRPVYETKHVNVPVEVQAEECTRVNHRNSSNSRGDRGLIENVVSGGFGSTSGLIGTVAGVAIVDEFGGNGNAKIVAGLLGNKLGNNYNSRGRKSLDTVEQCSIVTRVKYEQQESTYLNHYQVVVTDGENLHTVKRNRSPRVGERISVNIKVW